MPTPSSDSALQLISPTVVDDTANRTSCPPEPVRGPAWNELLDTSVSATISDSDAHDTPSATSSSAPPSLSTSIEDGPARLQEMRPKVDGSARDRDMVKPDDVSMVGRLAAAHDSPRSSTQPSSVNGPSSTALLSYEFSNIRLLPNHTSSFLRAGSKFAGTQQSDRQVYNVDVEIKHVDIAESYLCGYLRIQGLTEDHPTLTTFFEGEIIGTKHTFLTRNEAWGATEKTDMSHWSRFAAWLPLAKQAKKPDFTYRNFAQREHIFMRWKEYFLVPDHRVRTISGASFEGFYYICFNQVEGTVSGVYFHAKSERYQQLELKHVEDHGCTPAIEFR